MERTVTIEQQGREGRVVYREDAGAIPGYQEFGGADAVAIVSLGTVAEWRERHAWAVERRAQILRFIADELIRQQAPGARPDINDVTGRIVLRASDAGAAPAGQTPRAAAAAWVWRHSGLKRRAGVIGLFAVLVVGAALWVKTRVLVVQPGSGAPLGSTVRSDTHLATLIQQLQPYTPSLHRDASRDRYTLSLLLLPLAGGEAVRVPLRKDLPPGSYSLARVLGSDGRVMWVDVNGILGVDLRSHALVSGDQADPAFITRASGQLRSSPPLTQYLAAGMRAGSGSWLGLHSPADLQGAYQPGRWLRAVESASDVPRERRQLMRGEFEADSSDGAHWKLRAMTPLDDTAYPDAAFLRADTQSLPLRIADPDSLIMLHTPGDGIGAQATLLVSRVEIASGRLLWTRDTGLDRFKLEQVLPAEGSTAFVGTVPPVPGKVSEPIIALLDHATGDLTRYSLWQ